MTPRKSEQTWFARASQALHDLKWSVSELARRIGLEEKDAAKVRRWLRGENDAPFVDVVKIADALGMSLDTLAGRLPEPDADWDDASLAAVLKAAEAQPGAGGERQDLLGRTSPEHAQDEQDAPALDPRVHDLDAAGGEIPGRFKVNRRVGTAPRRTPLDEVLARVIGGHDSTKPDGDDHCERRNTGR